MVMSEHSGSQPEARRENAINALLRYLTDRSDQLVTTVFTGEGTSPCPPRIVEAKQSLNEFDRRFNSERKRTNDTKSSR